MAKGFGIAALVLAILSAFAMYGFNFATIWLGMICAAIAALNGDRGFSIASILIAGAGLLIFSPFTLGAIWASAHYGDYSGIVLGFAPFGIAIMALLVDVSRRAGPSVTAKAESREGP